MMLGFKRKTRTCLVEAGMKAQIMNPSPKWCKKVMLCGVKCPGQLGLLLVYCETLVNKDNQSKIYSKNISDFQINMH